MTKHAESQKDKTDNPNKTKKLEVAKETLRDLGGPSDASDRVKGGKRRPGPSEPSCDATCE